MSNSIRTLDSAHEQVVDNPVDTEYEMNFNPTTAAKKDADAEVEEKDKPKYPPRNNKYQHMYNRRAWRRLRKVFLADHYLCEFCGAPAGIVDHIEPHEGDYGKFFALDNLQALCKMCHDGPKARMERGIDLDLPYKSLGCDLTGNPLSPLHLWNK